MQLFCCDIISINIAIINLLPPCVVKKGQNTHKKQSQLLCSRQMALGSLQTAEGHIIVYGLL